MMKQWIGVLIFGICTVFSNSSFASITPIDTTITGRAKFESRYTRVPTRECESHPCQTSQIYWSLVITSGEARYVLSKKWNVGSPQAPEVIDLGGIPIHPGALVRLAGKVIEGDPNYYIILDVQSVSLLKELGYSCQNSGSADAKLHARVWFDTAAEDSDGAYKMRVNAFDKSSIHNVASIDHALVSVDSDRVVYEGQSSNTTIELSIQQKPSPEAQIPAVLKMSPLSQDGNSALHQESIVEMVCSPSRS